MNESIDKIEDQKDNAAALAQFYREHLLPLAELARERGVEFFPLAPDTDSTTYFLDRKHNGDYIHSIDAAALAEELRKMWVKDELPELTDLAPPLAGLAENLHEKEPVSDEVSPFIYAMF